ncbi:ERAD-associated E3 ubiquitin-protein ligase doa10 [Physcia stellaris]|nr:ERAD-associated E3 ubiquitin-protein ligase doa10 [Physcia stellaris]
MENTGGEPEVAAKPDVMNDPTFDTNSRNKGKAMEDSDTCRICRGEGSKEEPLFYPCKCSGSIKFVHQNCLMEWLSHSQKKHCELCKTPFRFTKLYSPHMPNSVPLLVFIRQAIVHAYKSILSWWRLQLVLFVWGACLPYVMRTIWRALFWFGDGGWVTWQEMERRATATAQQYVDNLAATGTTPANLNHFTSRDAAASAVVSHFNNAVPSILQPISSTSSFFSGGPLLFRLGRKLMRTMVRKVSNETIHAAPARVSTNFSTGVRLENHSSLLSNVSFLKSLTRFPKFNGILIDMIEGQIITLSIVVAFILIFLIREWVVQQQPAMAVAANAAPQEAQADAVEEDNTANNAQGLEDVEQTLLRAELESSSSNDDTNLTSTVELGVHQNPATVKPSIEDRLKWLDDHDFPRDLLDLPGTSSDHADDLEGQMRDEATTGEDPKAYETEGPGTSSIESRPSMPTREALGRAAEVRRTLEGISAAGGQKDRHSNMKVFTDIWIRAGNRPGEVLRIIDREGRNEELSWIVAAMKRLEHSSASNDRENAPPADPEQLVPEENRSSLNSVGEVRIPTSNSSSPKLSATWDEEQASRISPVDDIGTIPQSSGAERGQLKTGAVLSPCSDNLNRNEEDVSFGLRDISNQQFDGSADYAVSHKDDSDSSFVLLSNSSQQELPASNQPEDNPFAPSLEDYPQPNVPTAIDDAPTGDILRHLIDQEQNLAGLVDERNNLMREGNDLPATDGQLGLPNLVADPVIDRSSPPRGYLDRIMDWIWGTPSTTASPTDVQLADEEHVVAQVEEEAPFVPIAHGRPVFEQDGAPGQDPAPVPAPQDNAVAAAAAEAGLDANGAEAVDDAEDLEGIMELVGLQGPMFGLIQNAIFCAVIVAVTVALGIWIPYISGKVFLIFLANPVSLMFKMPLRWASTTADTLVDICIFSAGCSFYWTDTVISFVCRPVTRLIPQLAIITEQSALTEAAKSYAESALDRLARTLVATSGSFLESDVPTFSVVAHESLLAIKQGLSSSLMTSFEILAGLSSILSKHQVIEHATSLAHRAGDIFTAWKGSIVNGITGWKFSTQSISLNKVLQVNLNIPQRTAPLDFNLAYWNSKDRVLAILLGYTLFALIGVAYLRIRASLRGKNAAGRVEGSIADVLYQAGGVLKVILIISIEMIVFPLFCGLLLDFALLPLFGDVTFLSRLNFGLDAPWTSLFIHWFIGTCYMFHFALFVSMCRKLMRTGVLYFIRDPDDPTFHPVRDVLERNLFTQLRKIIFSAVVYGGLVMVCLGGVVWGVYYAFEGVFPVHWSPNEPVLEFPVDLLFYNFLMPVAVRFFKPSNALNNMYGWWFRRCARGLRLSHFLFGEKRADEEGHHVRRTWQDWLDGKLGDPSKPVTNIEQRIIQENREVPAYFLRDGRYVRAPASDQVRMPKGTHTFLEVDEYNNRVDKREDPEQGTHGRKNDQFTQIYIPPFFRLRISIFIFLIWLFAATTGVCTTVLPLILGRRIFAYIAPSHLRMNDIYAYSIGIYILGGSLYICLYAAKALTYVRSASQSTNSRTRSVFRRTQSQLYRLLRILYTYASFTVFLPALFALLIQAYFIVPLHTYFGTVSDMHTIHIMQDWTLGVLYIQAIGRLILWNSPSRPADALRRIVHHGWLNPDARLATRAFIFPATILLVFLLALPLTLGRIVNALYFPGAEEEVMRTLVYRYSAPAILALAVTAVALSILKGAFDAWRGRIRDEVYLIGERLHNFGESRRVRKAAKGRRVDVRA